MRDPVTDVANAILDSGRKVTRSGNEFKAQCPAHEDRTASLQIRHGDKGAVMHCHAGCTTEAIMAALNLDVEKLFDEPLRSEGTPTVREPVPGSEATYYYDDEHGKVLFRVERRADKNFVQARPSETEAGKWVYALGDTRRVPYRLMNVLGAVRDGEIIFIVEGEKDVHRIEMLGLVATCNPGGAGKFKREFAEFFADANVVVIPDNDKPGAEHAEHVVDCLGGVARTVRLLDLPYLPPKGDTSDWLDNPGWPAGLGGYRPHDGAFLRELALAAPIVAENKPSIFTASDLMREKYSEVNMVVESMIQPGLTILAGSPKIGKSWLLLGCALAVANGTPALGELAVDPGAVLYLALEDTPRRLQNRLRMMLGEGEEAPADLHLTCAWPKMNAGGLDQLDGWIKANPDVKLIIIDTLAKVHGAVSEGASMYHSDYAAMTAVKAISDRHGVAIVLVHHLRKAGDSDPLNMITGSTGLTGSVDALIVLTRQRGAADGRLYVTGRDVEESYHLVEFEAECGHWKYLGPEEEVQETRTEDQLIALLDDAEEPQTPTMVAAKLDIPMGTAKWLLAKLSTEQRICRVKRGSYVAVEKAPEEGTAPVENVPAEVGALPGIGGPALPSGVVTTADVDEWDAALALLEGEFGADDDERDDDPEHEPPGDGWQGA